MKSTHFIIGHTQRKDAVIALDGSRIVNQGTKEAMAATYHDLCAKAKSLVEAGLATKLREKYDGEIFRLRFDRDGYTITAYYCDRKAAAQLMIGQ